MRGQELRAGYTSDQGPTLGVFTSPASTSDLQLVRTGQLLLDKWRMELAEMIEQLGLGTEGEVALLSQWPRR